jgi:hypothetical protein
MEYPLILKGSAPCNSSNLAVNSSISTISGLLMGKGLNMDLRTTNIQMETAIEIRMEKNTGLPTSRLYPYKVVISPNCLKIMTAWKLQSNKQKYIVTGNQKNSRKIVNNTDITVL